MTENMKKFIWSSINIIHMANLVAWICKRYVLIVLFLKILNLKTCQSDQENSALSQMCRSCHLDKASNWRQMPNAYLLISLLLDWKEGQLTQQFSLLNHTTFAKPRRWPKMGFTAKQKIIRYSTWNSTFEALSKWHDPQKITIQKPSFSESAKSEHSSDYQLSLTQHWHSQSESVESVKFIEKSYPRVAQCHTCQSYCKRRQLASFQIYPKVLYNLFLDHCNFSLSLWNCWKLPNSKISAPLFWVKV